MEEVCACVFHVHISWKHKNNNEHKHFFMFDQRTSHCIHAANEKTRMHTVINFISFIITYITWKMKLYFLRSSCREKCFCATTCYRIVFRRCDFPIIIIITIHTCLYNHETVIIMLFCVHTERLLISKLYFSRRCICYLQPFLYIKNFLSNFSCSKKVFNNPAFQTNVFTNG